uniref:Glycosyltransferase n=1 Tax=Micrococcus phage Kurnik TaxID=3092208 RepID=A0AAU6R792_9CAUD
MSALEYLKDLPVFYINVDAHEHRSQRFMSEVAPLFREVHRVPAMKIENVVEEANDFSARVRASREHHDPRGIFRKFPSIYTIPSFNSETKRAREYAATRSLTLSTLRAVMWAKSFGFDRFMLMDDDAAARMQILETITPGPREADLTIWGGGYGSGGLLKDNQRFLAGETPRWVDISGKQGRFFSQAYEMTTAGADAIEYAIRNHFHAVDLMWWYAFDRVPTFTLQPSAFTQVGESVRVVKHNARTREGATVR